MTSGILMTDAAGKTSSARRENNVSPPTSRTTTPVTARPIELGAHGREEFLHRASLAPRFRLVIEFRDVHKHFGPLHVLRGINLTVRERDVVVIIGPSGSGKSTMIRTINKLEPIDSGELVVDGQRVMVLLPEP